MQVSQATEHPEQETMRTLTIASPLQAVGAAVNLAAPKKRLCTQISVENLSIP